MTVQEAKAKEVLNNIWDFADAQDEEKGDVVDDAIIEAIGCMDEVDQYRALGTVEELKNQKHNLSVAYKIIDDYRKIGTVEELKEAREKQVAKKVIVEDDGDSLLCPSCGLELMGSINDPDHDPYYCFECGQALKWGEEDD